MINYVEVANRADYISVNCWFIVLMIGAVVSAVIMSLSFWVYPLLNNKDNQIVKTVLCIVLIAEFILSIFVTAKIVPFDAYVKYQYSNLLSIANVSSYKDLKNIIKNVDYLKYRYELMWNNKSLLINGEKCSKDYYVNAVLNKFYGTGSENYEYSFDNEYDALVDNLKK